jgi:hypothetical protein
MALMGQLNFFYFTLSTIFGGILQIRESEFAKIGFKYVTLTEYQKGSSMDYTLSQFNVDNAFVLCLFNTVLPSTPRCSQ